MQPPISLWWDGLEPRARSSLDHDLDVDVVIVGGGFTGLWTAYSLLVADPTLRVALVEKELAGFGASGRNGGWCSALFAASDARVAREYGAPAALAMRRAMNSTIDEIGNTAEREGIDCQFSKGGTVVAARSTAQVARAHEEIEAARAQGIGEADLYWLDAESARTLLKVHGLLGATYTPHCAAIQPALLARGLADAVERHGGQIFEGTEALSIEPGSSTSRPLVTTTHGNVRADVVVRALEAWTPTMPGSQRSLIPVYSLMIATEPLDAGFWAEVGLHRRETFADFRHLIIYGQRTADGRLAFGGRGAPYHFGSAIRPSFDRVAAVHNLLHQTLRDLFPGLGDAAITHTWGGPLGIPRDWFSSVGLDRQSGVAWAGGYVGDGVSTTNLAGRTLADLILGRQSDLVALPWVGHRSPPWEPEPLRWLGVNAGLLAMRLGDRAESKRGRPSWVAQRMSRLLGE
jgi:glycine/D-amino acid oxidase-like deaminating enzyme